MSPQTAFFHPFRAVCVGLLLTASGGVWAQEDIDPKNDLYEPNAWYPSFNYQGSTGIIDTPTARFLPDGNFAIGASGKEPDQRVFFTFQPTPWFEGSFRYAHIQGLSETQPNFYDRSFALKIRLVTESRYRPAIAIGMNDLLGTGIQGGEYFVASKRFGDVDASFGFGWGRYGQAAHAGNPLSVISNRFESRESRNLGDTGQFDFGSYFSGPDIGFFGGIEYSPPIKRLDGLKLQLEYSSDRYLAEQAAPLIRYDVRSPVNVGLTYEPLDGMEVGAHYLYGNTFGIRFAFKADPRKRLKLPRFDAQPPEFRVRPEGQRRPQVQNLVDGEAFELARTRILREDSPYELRLAAHDTVPLQPAIRTRPGLRRDLATPLSVSEIYLSDAWGLPAQTALCLDRRSPAGMAGQACAEPARPPAALVQVASLNERDGFRLAGRDLTLAAAEVRGTRTLSGPEMTEDERYEKIAEEAARIYLSVQGIDRTGRLMRVYFGNRRYDRSAEALGRMTRVLTQYAPDDVELFELVMMNGAFPVTKVTITRTELERLMITGTSADEIFASIDIAPAGRGPGSAQWTPQGSVRSIDLDWEPGFRQSLFDPDDPFRYQFLLRLKLNVGLGRGLSFNTVYAQNLINNFDEIVRESNSQLPRVRSDFARYLQEGESGIDSMALNYEFKLADEIYARMSAGYLEEMFAGAGGEVLYAPQDRPWAVGVNAYAVRQRAFDKLFDLRDYETVTGHASLYYRLPWHGLQANIHAGRYLAQDYGATFELKRRFDTGVEIGAFATLTDVPFDEFGEGSFDKGLTIRIPFGWFSPYATKRQYNLDLRPLTRDGGQRLTGSTRLYDAILRESRYELERNWDGFVE